MNDLVDAEMIELLGICKTLKTPKLDSIQDKMVTFGENKGNKKLLILDMDETMLSAKFLEEGDAADDSHFVCTL